MEYVGETLIGKSIDELVIAGIDYIQKNGDRIVAHTGDAIQAVNVTYVLTDSRARLHTLRSPTSIRYFARELRAYFIGSLNPEDGLVQASNYWRTLKDKNGRINSNYGYYVFHQKTPDNVSQIDYVRKCFCKNKDTRKAIININNINHKVKTNDFPCTVAMVFAIRNDTMICDVMSRSTDVIMGLPYDLGFFAFVNELVCRLVSEDLGLKLKLGYTAIHTVFTQIYDKTADKIPGILDGKISASNVMPLIDSGQETLHDILGMAEGRVPDSGVVKWVSRTSK